MVGWLHAKLDGLPVAIDLAEKSIAFEIMAGVMAENDFEYRRVQVAMRPIMTMN